MAKTVLVIACGAIARELVRVQKMNHWEHIVIQCLPAEMHNRPEKIPAAVHDRISREKDNFERVFVAYADCGTGGLLDKVLAGTGVERIPGAHCYEFLAGSDTFHALADEEPGSFYLTDFLVQHFDRLVVRGLGLDRQPQLLKAYFGNYRRVVYLSQSKTTHLQSLAQKHAKWLGLDYHFCPVGDRPLELQLIPAIEKEVQWQR